MSYTINEKARVVLFACAHCAAEVRRPLTEAGTRQPCPVCMSTLTIPGEQEARAILLEERREAEDRRRIEEWVRSSPAPASPSVDAAPHGAADRLIPTALPSEHEALIHAFPGPSLPAEQRPSPAKPARRRRLGAAWPVLLLVAGLIFWYVTRGASGGW